MIKILILFQVIIRRLGLKDRLIEDIYAGKIKEEDLTAKFIRDNYKNRGICDNPKRKLGGGRKVLEDTKQLDQYLYSYGLMAQQQWDKAFSLKILPKEATIIDYACGQGLSMLQLVDQWSDSGSTNVKWKDRVKEVRLIEPSITALKRAQSVVGLKFPHSTIKAVNKKLENLDDDDLVFEPNKTYIHIFSQVLDIPMSSKFSINELFERITSTIGTHYILIVGNKIDLYERDDIVLQLYEYVSREYIFEKEIELLLKEDSELVRKVVTDKTVKDIAFKNYQIRSTENQSYDCNSLFIKLKTVEKVIEE
mgnify:CR=1 FL=1